MTTMEPSKIPQERVTCGTCGASWWWTNGSRIARGDHVRTNGRACSAWGSTGCPSRKKRGAPAPVKHPNMGGAPFFAEEDLFYQDPRGELPPWVYPGAKVRVKRRGHSYLPSKSGRFVSPDYNGTIERDGAGELEADFCGERVGLRPFPCQLAPVLFRDWNPAPEFFRSPYGNVDVALAKRRHMVKPTPCVGLRVSVAAACLVHPELGSPEARRELERGAHTYDRSFAYRNEVVVSWDRVAFPDERATEGVPVVVLATQRGLFIVDGWHRIARAHVTGRPWLPAVVIPRGDELFDC